MKPRIWVTADWHLYHKNILKLEMSTRPYTCVDQMHEAFITEWGSKVSPSDTTYILGDLSFGTKAATSEVLSKMPGKKVLVRGNHDRKLDLLEACEVTEQFAYLADYFELQVSGQLVCMSHFPMAQWNRKHFGSIMLHGHTHGGSAKEARRRDVGVDATGQLLTNMEELVEQLMLEPYDSVRNYHKGQL
jgi:calcineurin-like phosphoesterase family protein